MKDLESLLPHSRKDAKFDNKNKLYLLNELADLNNCNNCIFLEVRKHTDLYLWMSKTPLGPSVRFHVQNGASFLFVFTCEALFMYQRL
jgi:ribosome biogenesis protein BRX1